MKLMTDTSPTPSKPSLIAAGSVYRANFATVSDLLPAQAFGVKSNCPSWVGGMCPPCSIEDEPSDQVLRTGLLSPLLSADPAASTVASTS